MRRVSYSINFSIDWNRAHHYVGCAVGVAQHWVGCAVGVAQHWVGCAVGVAQQWV